MKKTIETVSVIASANVLANTFADYNGGTSADMALARGVYLHDAQTGESVSVMTQGIIEVINSGGVTQGDEVKSNVSGQAVTATTGDYVNGIALNTVIDGKKALVELKYYKI